MTESSSVSSFSHVILVVGDLDQTIDFYTDNLGFKLLRRYKLGANAESAYIGLGGVLLELIVSRDFERPGSGPPANPIGLTVTDLDGLLAGFQAKGIECGKPYEARTFWGRQAKIRDNSGYLVSLREWQAPDGPQFQGWTPRHDDVLRSD